MDRRAETRSIAWAHSTADFSGEQNHGWSLEMARAASSKVNPFSRFSCQRGDGRLLTWFWFWFWFWLLTEAEGGVLEDSLSCPANGSSRRALWPRALSSSLRTL